MWCYLDLVHCSECRAVNCPALAAAPDPSNECSKRPLGTSAMGLSTHQRGSHKMPLPPQPNCQRSLPTAPPGGGLTRRCQIDRGRAAGSHQAAPRSPAPVDLLSPHPWRTRQSTNSRQACQRAKQTCRKKIRGVEAACPKISRLRPRGHRNYIGRQRAGKPPE